MKVDAFDFQLPEENIALHPFVPREAARLLRITPPNSLADYHIGDLPQLLRPGDALVLNDTKVIPARLNGKRLRPAAAENAAAVSIGVNLHQRAGSDSWRAFVKPARRLRLGDEIIFAAADKAAALPGLAAQVAEKGEAGEMLLRFDKAGAALDAALAEWGQMPLPPYIAGRRAIAPQDKRDYQTIFAREAGAVAAPTAGLHFTPHLLAALRDRGVELHFVTLHVGAGTFLPVKADDTKNHKMHSESGVIDAPTAEKLQKVKERGGKIIAVGTTALRVLETAASADGHLRAWAGATDIFITPGYRFRFVDRLLTNFHLPRSTLFMLVSAFSGLELMQKAYRRAIEKYYRFYSYGDACLLDKAE